jgi:hypothetical protein
MFVGTAGAVIWHESDPVGPLKFAIEWQASLDAVTVASAPLAHMVVSLKH